MKKDCVFCKIINKEIPARFVFENEKIIAFHDIRPQAPIHILIIPREHIPTINDLEMKHKEIIGDMFLTAKQIAKQEGLSDPGYRLVFNCNHDAGQEVYHIHLHLLGGRRMMWPPG